MVEELPKELVTPGERNFSFPVEGREDGQGYFCAAGRESKNAIVLIQEWWGLNVSICKTAEVFAEKGFAVLAVDIYRGKCADSRETAGHLFTGLDFAGAVQDIKAAAIALKAKGYAKIGITGFCMGGALTVAAIASCDEFSAAAPFYGVPDLSKLDLSRVKVPVLAHFGEKDLMKGFSDKEAALNLESAMKGAGVAFTLHLWDAGHAFMNQANPANYHPEIARQALEETTQFFNKSFE
jgi:carboxymethylenebutenolidase